MIPPPREYYLGEENKLQITVNIWGEVSNPGSYRVPDDIDLVGLVSLAGGPTDFANLGHVRISRPNGNEEHLLEVDLKRFLNGDSGENPVTLLPGDTVRVPRNTRHAWKSAIQTLSEVAAVVTLYVLIDDRHRNW